MFLRAVEEILGKIEPETKTAGKTRCLLLI
jgi:hypothetical protein